MNTYTTPTQETSDVEHSSATATVQSKAVAWLGVTGSTLLMLSATIFVWSGWNEFPDAAKFGIIAMITGLCFGTGKFLSRTLPVMGSIFTHLAIFLTPIVLLSGNMEAGLPWREFLLLEGFFCVIWFFAIAQVFKSPVLVPASIASTVLIALGLSSLENTIFGHVPAALYLLPVLIGLASIKKYSRASLLLLVVVGFSPILTLIQPFINTGRGVLAGFGFENSVPAIYSLVISIGLLVATIVASRMQKSVLVLALIPITVVPYLLVSLLTSDLDASDWYVIAPLAVLSIQSLLILAKMDLFFKSYADKVVKPLTVTFTVLQGYVVMLISGGYLVFLAFGDESNIAFLETKQTIGLLLFVCASLTTYLNKRDEIQEFLLTVLGFFTTLSILELPSLIQYTHTETRMLVSVISIGIFAIVFRKNYLASIIVPMTAVGVYISASNHSTKLELLTMAGVYVATLLYGIYALRGTKLGVQWVSVSFATIWLITSGFCLVQNLLPENTVNHELYILGFIFLGGLVLAEAFDAILMKKSYLFAMESHISYVRPSRILLFTAFMATWFVGIGIEPLATLIVSISIVALGVLSSWRRHDSLMMILIAPTFVVGVYAMGDYFALESRSIPLILVGVSGFWLFLSTYMKNVKIGCYSVGALSAVVGIIGSFEYEDSLGQVLFLLGLIIVAIGIIRSVVALIPIGAVMSTVGLWITLAEQDINALTLYVTPVCVGLIALGMYNRNVFPASNKDTAMDSAVRTSSWGAYTFPLVLFMTASFLDSVYSGLHIYSLIGGAVALVAVAIGAWRKLIAPLVIGTGFLFVFILREIFDVANVVPVWAWIGLGAFTLIAIAVTLEKSQLSPSQARKKLSAVVADHFE